jgi:ribosomal protein S10
LQIILKDIIEESKIYNFNISGQIISPSKKTLFTVLRSPHIDKKARDQFEIRTYKIGFKINFENISDDNLKNILTFIQYIKLRSLGNKLNYKLIKKL